MNRTPQELKDRILSERSSGRSYREIASRLNNEGVPTQNGKSWYATTVKNILDRISGEKT
jgi:hypothetical protein